MQSVPITTDVSSNFDQGNVYNIIQLMPALKVNIIIVHPWDVVFPRAEGKQYLKSEQL